MSISKIDTSGISSVSSANITGLIQSSQIANISNTQIVGTTLPGPGQVTNVMLDVASANGTGSISVPSGTTAQRPPNP